MHLKPLLLTLFVLGVIGCAESSDVTDATLSDAMTTADVQTSPDTMVTQTTDSSSADLSEDTSDLSEDTSDLSEDTSDLSEDTSLEPNDSTTVSDGSTDTSSPGPGTNAVAGENCTVALGLTEQSEPQPPGSTWPHQFKGNYGETNDYNPLSTSGMAPGCSMVYDAAGNDVVVKVDLAPGETIQFEYWVTPATLRGGIYVLDSCPDASWPDYDESGACGDNEYAVHGFCLADCGPLSFAFTHPSMIDGESSTTQTYWFVLDTVGEELGESFELNWKIVPPTP